jgi:hypothetical protein
MVKERLMGRRGEGRSGGWFIQPSAIRPVMPDFRRWPVSRFGERLSMGLVFLLPRSDHQIRERSGK